MTDNDIHNIEQKRTFDQGLRQALARRQERVPRLSADFAERTLSRLAADQRPTRPAATARHRRLWPLWAAAAAVAGICVAWWNAPSPLPLKEESHYHLVAQAPSPLLLKSGNRLLFVADDTPDIVGRQITTTRHRRNTKVNEPAITSAADTISLESARDTISRHHSEGQADGPSFRLTDSDAEALLARHDATATPITGEATESVNTPAHNRTRPIDLALNYNTSLSRSDGSIGDDISGLKGETTQNPSQPSQPTGQTPGDGSSYTDTEKSENVSDDDSSNDNAGKSGIATRSDPTNGMQILDEERQYSHNLPISFGLSLRIPVGQRLAIETGLTYTYLQSTVITKSQIEFYNGSITSKTFRNLESTQRIHYLGIPLHLQARILGQSHWQLYASAGITMDIPVSATRGGEHFDADYVNLIYHGRRHISASVQWSADLGIGLQYNITQHFGLYVQPSMQWFIPTGSDIETYRTEHPLQFTIPIGIRLSF